jgi:hypothetical protein
MTMQCALFSSCSEQAQYLTKGGSIDSSIKWGQESNNEGRSNLAKEMDLAMNTTPISVRSAKTLLQAVLLIWTKSRRFYSSPSR